MSGMPPNGDGVSTREWVRDILKFLVDKIDDAKSALQQLIEANDKRYDERWKAQEQAIAKQESAQAQYNVGHNGLLADSRKQTDEVNRRFENVATKDDLTQRITSATDRVTVLDKSHVALVSRFESHLDLAMHPGALARLESLERDVKILRDASIKDLGASSTKVEQRAEVKWSTQMVLVALGMVLSLVFSVINLLRG